MQINQSCGLVHSILNVSSWKGVIIDFVENCTTSRLLEGGFHTCIFICRHPMKLTWWWHFVFVYVGKVHISNTILSLRD